MRDRLKELRIKRGLTVKDVASKVGISIWHYYKIEQGQRNPTILVARRIAETLGATIDGLFFAPESNDTSKEASADA
ncbi:MAG: helix-turn-helix transcriptional regulator [Syntrophothermus sp.]|uniref:helix-turn-helix transcriptional regulator n=1 Tax=Syntrophothermus sp. TaxID=2736299 RepID=UPI0025809A8F|nr:helix-turn-helix transcriptional regulator [Syntrophothermus sp.]NSW84491.1 helix-turn-helix transcriptional regulator [Syntrophothermus sp.]